MEVKDPALDEMVAVEFDDETGGFSPKRLAEASGMRLLMSHAMLFNSSGEVLLIQKSHDLMESYWDAGVIKNLTPEDGLNFGWAAYRGLKEDLGTGPIAIQEFATIAFDRPLHNERFTRKVTTFYSVLREGKVVVPNPEAVKAIEWVSPAGLYGEVMNKTRQFGALSISLWMLYASDRMPDLQIRS